jgi:hypothetical protein
MLHYNLQFILMEFIVLCCDKLVVIYILLSNTNLLNLTLHATCSSVPRPSSGIKITQFKTQVDMC